MKRNSFLIVTKQLAADKRVSATAKLLFAQLCEYRNSRTGQCNPKRRTVAEAIGASVDKVDRAAQELQRAGYLTWKRSRYTAFYEIPVPQECGTEPAQFRTGAEVVPHICGTAPPVPLYEPSLREPERPRAEARSRRGASPKETSPNAALEVSAATRKGMGLAEMFDPLNGRFLTKTQMDQLTYAMIIENHRAKYGG